MTCASWTNRNTPLKLFSSFIVLSALALAGLRADAATTEPSHFADADNSALVDQGVQVYMQNCANCHGRRLQGQALWQLRDQYEGRRAPPHDSTGHTWQHSDEELFTVTKTGKFSTTPKEIVSYMPAFDKR